MRFENNGFSLGPVCTRPDSMLPYVQKLLGVNIILGQYKGRNRPKLLLKIIVPKLMNIYFFFMNRQLQQKIQTLIILIL